MHKILFLTAILFASCAINNNKNFKKTEKSAEAQSIENILSKKVLNKKDIRRIINIYDNEITKKEKPEYRKKIIATLKKRKDIKSHIEMLGFCGIDKTYDDLKDFFDNLTQKEFNENAKAIIDLYSHNFTPTLYQTDGIPFYKFTGSLFEDKNNEIGKSLIKKLMKIPFEKCKTLPMYVLRCFKHEKLDGQKYKKPQKELNKYYKSIIYKFEVDIEKEVNKEMHRFSDQELASISKKLNKSLKKTKEIAKEMIRNKIKSVVCENKGDIYIELVNKSKANKYYNKTIEYLKKIANPNDIIFDHLEVFLIYLKKIKDIKKAKNYLSIIEQKLKKNRIQGNEYRNARIFCCLERVVEMLFPPYHIKLSQQDKSLLKDLCLKFLNIIIDYYVIYSGDHFNKLEEIIKSVLSKNQQKKINKKLIRSYALAKELIREKELNKGIYINEQKNFYFGTPITQFNKLFESRLAKLSIKEKISTFKYQLSFIEENLKKYRSKKHIYDAYIHQKNNLTYKKKVLEANPKLKEPL